MGDYIPHRRGSKVPRMVPSLTTHFKWLATFITIHLKWLVRVRGPRRFYATPPASNPGGHITQHKSKAVQQQHNTQHKARSGRTATQATKCVTTHHPTRRTHPPHPQAGRREATSWVAWVGMWVGYCGELSLSVRYRMAWCLLMVPSNSSNMWFMVISGMPMS